MPGGHPDFLNQGEGPKRTIEHSDRAGVSMIRTHKYKYCQIVF